MGSSASSSGAPGGYPPPPANGTTLEAALAQIEEEQLQKVRAPPGPTPRADPSLTRVTERCRHRPRGVSNGPDSTLHRPNPTSHPAILLPIPTGLSRAARRSAATPPPPARSRRGPGHHRAGPWAPGVVESDEAMAQRLQREERGARERVVVPGRVLPQHALRPGPARARPSDGGPEPSHVPSFLAPVPHPAPAPAFSFPRPPGPPPPSAPPPTTESLGRRAMNRRDRAQHRQTRRDVDPPPSSATVRIPASRRRRTTPPTPTCRLGMGGPVSHRSVRRPVNGGGAADDDEALARALQARQEEEEEEERRVREARRRTTPPPPRRRTPPPPMARG